MIRIGMIIGDRYEIREKIGTGGMSDVYRAHDHKLNRPVAVKVLKAEFSDNQNFVEKFHSEAQAAAGLMHPNIVNVYDVGNDKGIHYFVMELVDGITLKKYIEKKSRLSVREAVSIGIQVAMGLDAAHKNGIIHRDIKPQNIMISKEGKVKVTDFGIAKAASSNTITSNVMGSVHYTSPEQARGGFSDAKSDIYSLGVTLFEMVTGRVPYNGDTTVAIAIKHIQEPFPAPKEYAPDLPVSVEKIIIKCCQKSPDRRYQNAQELIADLKRSLIEPDSDFVVLIDPDVVGATRIATDGEQETIRHQNTGISRTEQMRLREDLPQAPEPIPAPQAPVNDQNIRRPVNNYNKPAPPQRPSQPDRPRPANGSDTGLDKTMIIMGVIAAVMLVFFLVLFVLSRLTGQSGTDDPTSATSGGVPVEDNIGIIVPEVIGDSFAEAKSILTEKGFKVEKVSDDESKEPLNTVTGQSVAQGSRLAAGETITLNVSSGKGASASDAASSASTEEEEKDKEDDGKTLMPSVIGMDEAAARLTLVENGFDNDKIIIIEVNNDNEGLTGSILNQTPGSGTEVEKATQVTLEMSIGPAKSQTYSFAGTIDAPGEDSMYTPGTPVNITITASDGTLLLSTATSSFPYTVSSLSGIASSTGTLEMNFVITTPMTTDPVTGVTQGGSTETRSVTRVLNFTPES